MGKELNYRIDFNGTPILDPSEIDMQLAGNESFSSGNRIKSHSIKKVNNVIVSPVPEKRKNIPDNYNLITLGFKLPYTVEFRVYDDGVAYRFVTSFKDSITVQNEIAEFNFFLRKKEVKNGILANLSLFRKKQVNKNFFYSLFFHTFVIPMLINNK